ncbi:peptidase [Solwaraspora sp. WMMD406]|uniref:peptidase n=1 Tax=Solwaraspora sp. WMMD406 TaxID=3016095 RepID=UPI002416D716|nr:peptidase [Solwaraspora sp. WMMD406]MDG4763552.1 peptidase [Solwaraspora sp. WMMD406]
MDPVRTALTTGALPLLAGALTLLAATPAAAQGPTPVPVDATLTKAGTSFLTAAAVNIDQPVRVSAATGEYLYWSFPAVAGQTSEIAATISLPDPASRSGDVTWTIDVFDGLRRRQACTAGAQSPNATVADRTVRAGCLLRQVRSWAEPWSGDPLPGTYYVRVSVADLTERDLGLPVRVELRVTADVTGDPRPEGGQLRSPLHPTTRQGSVDTSTDTASAVSDTAADDGTASSAEGSDDGAEASEDTDGGTARSWWDRLTGWLPEFSSRWVWTAAGGALAAIAGVIGFGLTRRPRRPAVG